jgi:hypothetical protein
MAVPSTTASRINDLAAALVPAHVVGRAQRIELAITDDGRPRLDRTAGTLEAGALPTMPSRQVGTEEPTSVSTAINLGTFLLDLSDTVVERSLSVVDSPSIDLTLGFNGTNDELSADAVFGTTAGTVAEGNHSHAYVPASRLLTATATLDFGSIAVQTCGELTIAVTGAAVGDAVALGPPPALEAGVAATGYVSAADVVTVRLCNASSGAIDPLSSTWRATVIRP